MAETRTDAIVIVHWPGKDTPACIFHALKLAGVAEVLGFPLSSTPAPEGAVCSNCENEKVSRG